MRKPLRHFSPKTHSGSTLVELLAVVLILAILASLLIPFVDKGIKSVRSTKCMSNLRQIYVAAQAYSTDHSQVTSRRKYNFYADLWAYAYPNIPYKVTWDNPPPEFVGTIFECPAVYQDPFAVKRSYGINSKMASGYGNEDLGVPLIRITMPSKTVYIADTKSDSGLHPEVNGSTCSAYARHNNRMNALFFDGHIEAVEITPEISSPANIYNCPFWMSPTN